jgi:Rrf2 family protein
VLLEQAPTGELVTRQKIADYHDIPESYLAKHLKALVDNGVFVAISGPNGGYQLARPASKITGLDIFEAIEGPRPAFTCTEIRQRGTGAARPEDCKRKCAINALMLASDRAWRDRLAQTTVADLVRTIPRTDRIRNRKMMTRS